MKLKPNKKSEAKIKPLFTEKELGMLAEEYADISAQMKALDERKKLLAEKIKTGAETLGVKDDKGSFYLESNGFVLGKVASKSMAINTEEAVKKLKELGLKHCYSETKVVVKKVDEKELEKAVNNGEITLDEVETFTDVKTNYKVLVKVAEELPEIEQSNLAVAKRKK